ncbi:MAG TPA: hypothetical protein VIJ51_06465 [Solirubrobacteraceae bacterium]
MRAPSVKPQYGPTLADLVIPRWRSSSVGLRSLLVLAAVVVAAAAAVVILRPRGRSFVYRGSPVSFNLSYLSPLRVVAPPAGADMRIEARTSSGRLREWFEVDPLRLGPYSGQISGQLPVFATTYIAGLARRIPGFLLQSEAKTRINLIAGYSLTYSGRIAGQLMYGRVVMLVPALTGQREGVILSMGIQPSASVDYSPDAVGSADILEKPLRSFRFGA